MALPREIAQAGHNEVRKSNECSYDVVATLCIRIVISDNFFTVFLVLAALGGAEEDLSDITGGRGEQPQQLWSKGDFNVIVQKLKLQYYYTWYPYVILHGDDLYNDVVLPTSVHPFQNYTNRKSYTPEQIIYCIIVFITNPISHGHLRCTTPVKLNTKLEKGAKRSYKVHIETLRLFYVEKKYKERGVLGSAKEVRISGLTKDVTLWNGEVIISTT